MQIVKSVECRDLGFYHILAGGLAHFPVTDCHLQIRVFLTGISFCGLGSTKLVYTSLKVSGYGIVPGKPPNLFGDRGVKYSSESHEN